MGFSVGTIGVLSSPVVMSENPANHVFVNWDVERQDDLLGDSRTAPNGITLLHLDDRMNEIYARPFRTGLPAAIRGEEHPVLLLAQDFVKPEQCRGLQCNCRTEKAGWTHQERQQAGKDAVPTGQIGRSLPGAIHDQELVFQEKRLRDQGTDATRSNRASVAIKWITRTARLRIEE